MSRKGLVAIIVLFLIIAGCIGGYFAYKNYIDDKIKQSLQDYNKESIYNYFTKIKGGKYPKEMESFRCKKSEDLFELCYSHPNDLFDKNIILKNNRGVLLYRDVELDKYKRYLLPELKVLIGKFLSPNYTYSNNSRKVKSLPNSPDWKVFQNTLLEWCFIAKKFEEKNDGNSAFIMCYGAIRLSLSFITDYSDGASLENLKTVNNIIRCACCQMIDIANSGLNHNSNMVRAIAKDLFVISESYPSVKRLINYNLYLIDELVSEKAQNDNYVSSYVKNNRAENMKFSSIMKKAYEDLFAISEISYKESLQRLKAFEKDIRLKVKDSLSNFDNSKITESLASILIEKSLFDFEKVKFDIDLTKLIINGAATTLATYEFFDNKKGNITYSPEKIANYVGYSYPSDPLSGGKILINFSRNVFSNTSRYGIYSEGIDQLNIKDDIIFVDYEMFSNRCNKKGFKSVYFDEDAALSKMTSEEQNKYNEAKQYMEKQKKEAEASVKELLKKYEKDMVEVDSINDICCGYHLGKIPNDVKESYIQKSGLIRSSYFGVKAKEPFIGLFYSATVMVNSDTKVVKSISYSISFDTTSERDVALADVIAYLEKNTGSKGKIVSNNENVYSLIFPYEKENANVKVNLLKGWDGGGTLSVSVFSK